MELGGEKRFASVSHLSPNRHDTTQNLTIVLLVPSYLSVQHCYTTTWRSDFC